MASVRSFSIEISPKAAVVARALRQTRVEVLAEALLLTAAAAEEGEKWAHVYLDNYVYHAPLPQSAYTTWGGPAHYLERSRVGRTKAAIKKVLIESAGIDEAASKVYVDPADYQGYFYALSLEFGMMSRYTSYHPRPFWRDTVETMKELFGKEGEVAAHKMTSRIAGRFA